MCSATTRRRLIKQEEKDAESSYPTKKGIRKLRLIY